MGIDGPAHTQPACLSLRTLSHACDMHRRAAGDTSADAVQLSQGSEAPIPDYDDVLALRFAAAVLYELYISTGDERFYQAREALVKDLPMGLFEPPMPLSRSTSRALSDSGTAGSVSVSDTDTEPQADDAKQPKGDESTDLEESAAEPEGDET